MTRLCSLQAPPCCLVLLRKQHAEDETDHESPRSRQGQRFRVHFASNNAESRLEPLIALVKTQVPARAHRILDWCLCLAGRSYLAVGVDAMMTLGVPRCRPKYTTNPRPWLCRSKCVEYVKRKLKRFSLCWTSMTDTLHTARMCSCRLVPEQPLPAAPPSCAAKNRIALNPPGCFRKSQRQIFRMVFKQKMPLGPAQ